MNQLYFNNKPIKLHQKFKDTFTFNEINNILEKVSIVIDTEFDETIYSIIIQTKKYYFELNVNTEDSLFIYYYDNDSEFDFILKELTKEEFINKLYEQDNNSRDMDIIIIEDEGNS